MTPYSHLQDIEEYGVTAVVTTRAAGSLGLGGDDPVAAVLARWDALRAAIGASGPASRIASAIQVHGANVVVHEPGWTGWLRVDAADGHIAPTPGTALAVTIADCVPVFIAHPSRVVSLVHAGWRGTSSHILPRAIELLRGLGLAPRDIRIHLGPAICGQCYEVGAAVYSQLTGATPRGSRTVDLRGILADQARDLGVRQIETSEQCTRCDNGIFYSHRAGDAGRQVAAVLASNV